MMLHKVSPSRAPSNRHSPLQSSVRPALQIRPELSSSHNCSIKAQGHRGAVVVGSTTEGTQAPVVAEREQTGEGNNIGGQQGRAPRAQGSELAGQGGEARMGDSDSNRQGGDSNGKGDEARGGGSDLNRQGGGSKGKGSEAKERDSDYKSLLVGSVSVKDEFIEISLRCNKPPSANMPWKMVTVRPVLLKGQRVVQFSSFGERQNIVKNYSSGASEGMSISAMTKAGAGANGSAEDVLLDLLLLPWTSIQLKTLNQEYNIQVTKKGKVIVHRSTPVPSSTVEGKGRRLIDMNVLSHDRSKDLPIVADIPHPFLKRIGFQTSEGKVKADMRDKLSQVNDFLKLLGHTGALEQLRGPSNTSATEASGTSASTADSPSSSTSTDSLASSSTAPIRILDAGCGSSHLTLCTYHYLNNVKNMKTCIMGVDSNKELMARSNSYCREMGLSEEEAQFYASPIVNFIPAATPDIVLALHACDTATDEALALGVKQGASIIMAVPCCHKNLHKQMQGSPAPAPFGPLMHHGIMKQRTVDLLTDTFRAQILRILGYKTDVVEFVSSEHTPRNLLIRAVRVAREEGAGVTTEGSVQAGRVQQLVEEYASLKQFWGGLTPHLEKLLAEELSPLLGDSLDGSD